MATSLPGYIGTAFDDCPPGHRFGLYFDGWTPSFSITSTEKTASFKKATSLPEHSRRALTALRDRQKSAADTLRDKVFSYPARLTAPLATGLGNEHPLENGFAFLNPYGLPYLAGSGVKGVLRRAAEELASEDWGDTGGWSKTAIDTLFGLGEENPERDSAPRRGALEFWDLFFMPPKHKGALAVEIMAAHHGGYLQGTGTPHANESPNPIPFLAIPAGSECTIFVICTPALIPTDQAALSTGWQNLIEAAIAHASEWLGFGAKTSVGYGRMQIDPKTAAAREEQRTREAALRVEQEKAAAVAALPADRRLLSQIIDFLDNLPANPKDGQPIVQQTSGAHWSPLLDLLSSGPETLSAIGRADREALAGALGKHIRIRFKVEGKADKALKQSMAAIRGD